MIRLLILNALVSKQFECCEVQQAYIWWIVGGILGYFAIIFGICFVLDSIPTKNTKSIVILGSVSSGKTTLWRQLRDETLQKIHVSTSEELIEEFDITVGEKTVTINSTKDIGGGDQWVSYYEELIQDGTFVYFLVDLTRFKETKDEIRARIKKISTIISEKKYTNCGLQIVATHYDEFFSKTNSSKNNAASYVKQKLNIRSINNFKVHIDDKILVANLLDKSDVEIIKKAILDIFNG